MYCLLIAKGGNVYRITTQGYWKKHFGGNERDIKEIGLNQYQKVAYFVILDIL